MRSKTVTRRLFALMLAFVLSLTEFGMAGLDVYAAVGGDSGNDLTEDVITDADEMYGSGLDLVSTDEVSDEDLTDEMSEEIPADELSEEITTDESSDEVMPDILSDDTLTAGSSDEILTEDTFEETYTDDSLEQGSEEALGSADDLVVYADESMFDSLVNTDNAPVIGYGGKKWRLVGYKGRWLSKQANTMTLLSEDILGKSAFTNAEPSNNIYSGSVLQSKLKNDIYDNFSYWERNYVSRRNLTTGTYSLGNRCDGVAEYEVSSAEIWPLSSKEAGDLNAKIAGSSDSWWLRSPGSEEDMVAYVNADGSVCYEGGTVCVVGDDLNYVERGIRPAFNFTLNDSTLHLLKKNPATSEYKFSLMNINEYLDSSKLKVAGDHIYVPNFSVYRPDEFNQISVLITDKTLSSNNTGVSVLYYGKLNTGEKFLKSGTGVFVLPSDLDVDDWGTSYHVFIYPEQINGAAESDVMGRPYEISHDRLQIEEYVTVTFDTDGHGKTPAEVKVPTGDKVIRPKDPSADGYIFNGWLLNGELFDFSSTVNEDITLVADWERGTDYGLRVGCYKVTSGNKDNIPGIKGGEDAKASYNPSTKTLTFSGNVEGVTGTSEGSGHETLIYSRDDLTIAGYADLPATRVNVIVCDGTLTISGGLYCNTSDTNTIVTGKDLIIKGDLDARNYSRVAVDASGKIVIRGFISAEGIIGRKGIDFKSGHADIYISEGKAVSVPEGYEITIASGLTVTKPENGMISNDKTFISGSDGTTAATSVTIEEVSPYGLYVGSTAVNASNRKNIPGIIGGSNAKASYDPDTKTLTFSGNVTGVTGFTENYYRYLIRSSDELTIKGSAALSTGRNYAAISCGKQLTLDGDFRFNTGMGIWGNNITVKGSLYLENANPYVGLCASNSLIINADEVTIKNGYITGDTVEILSGTIDVDSGKDLAAIEADPDCLTISDDMEIVYPAGAKICNTDTKMYIAETDGTTRATAVTIKSPLPPSPYGLYVGNVSVNEQNKNNIPGMTGKGANAVYDPKENTLTFTKVTGIKGEYTKDSKNYKIYTKEKLTIKGDLVSTDACDYGIYSEKALNLAGNINLQNARYGVYSDDDATNTGSLKITNTKNGIHTNGNFVQSGKLTVDVPDTYTYGAGIENYAVFKSVTLNGDTVITCSGSNNYGILINNGDMIVSSGNTRVTSTRGASAISAKRFSMNGGTLEAHQDGTWHSALSCSSIILNKVVIVDPVDGIVSGDGKEITTGSGTNAKDIKILPDDPSYVATVTFMNGEDVFKIRKVEKGTVIGSLPTPTVSAGMRFIGWYYDETFFDKAVSTDIMNKDTPVYAKVISDTVVTHEVRFEPASFGIPSQIVEHGDKAICPGDTFEIYGSPARVRYWYVSDTNELYDFTSPVTEDLSLSMSFYYVPDNMSFSMEFNDLSMYNTANGHWEVTYTGSKYTFDPVDAKDLLLFSPFGELEYRTDYTLSYKNNLNVSKKGKPAYVTAKGKGKYSKTKKLPFYIVARSIVNEENELDTENGFSMEPIVIEYNKKISPVIYYKGKKLTSKDYTLSKKGKIKADTTVDITGKGNFKGILKNVPVKVLKKADLKAQTIKVSLKANKHTYMPNRDDDQEIGLRQTLSVTTKTGGTVNKGELTVTDSKGNILIQQTDEEPGDFTVSYRDNIRAGTATVIISAVAPRVGSVKKTFKISPNTNIKLEKIDVINPSGIDYVTGGVYPDDLIGAKAVDNAVPNYDDIGADDPCWDLVMGRDYKITYTDNKAVSSGKKAKYKITFLGNYKGHPALNGEFTINAGKFKPVAGFTVAQGAADVRVADMVYSGNKKYKYAPYVSMSGKAVDKKNYTVKYFYEDGEGEHDITGKKITLADGENMRLIRVDVTGKGNYKEETVSKYYYVRRVSDGMINLSKAKIAAKGNKKKKGVSGKTYTGTEICPEVDVYVKVKKKWVLVDPVCYNVSYINNVNKGSATILVTGKGGKAVGSKVAKFKILSKSLGGFLAKLRID